MWVKHPISLVRRGGRSLFTDALRSRREGRFLHLVFIWEISQGSISTPLTFKWWDELHGPREGERALRWRRLVCTNQRGQQLLLNSELWIMKVKSLTSYSSTDIIQIRWFFPHTKKIKVTLKSSWNELNERKWWSDGLEWTKNKKHSSLMLRGMLVFVKGWKKVKCRCCS